MKYRVWLRSVPGFCEQYDGHVDVHADSHDQAKERALRQLKQGCFPDRSARVIDLTKLTPAPWSEFAGSQEEDLTFIALARDAFDVLMRRGWSCVKLEGRWIVRDEKGMCLAGAGYQTYDDPFTCLVECDKWFSEHEEKSGQP